MTSASSLFRSLLIYGSCLPLAVFLGYMLATPYDVETFSAVGIVVLILVTPLLLQWHHAWLIASWNTALTLVFLPGKPGAWLVLAWVSLGISILQYTLNRKLKLITVPSMTRPLIFFTVVVVVTAHLTGGMGMRIFGGETQGGKRYLMLFTAVVGYFAISCKEIPKRKAVLYVTLFILGQATLAIGDLVSMGAPGMGFLLYFFPVGDVRQLTDPGVVSAQGYRYILLGPAGAALVSVLLARYGVREIFSWRRPGRFLLLFGCVTISMMGGYRSGFIWIGLVFVILFWLEDLIHSSLTPILLLSGILAIAVLAPFVTYLPFSFQRSLSFLPFIQVDPMVRESARGSTEWRLMMWRHVAPQVPEYLLLGKGYSFSGKDIDLIRSNPRGGELSTEGFEYVGDYHNGPLSVIIPFGIAGTIGFIWLLVAGFKVLHRNFLYGDPDFRRLNAFMLAYFVAKVLLFLAVFGSLYSDLVGITGILGLSVSVNGGLAGPVRAPEPSREPLERFAMPARVRRGSSA